MIELECTLVHHLESRDRKAVLVASSCFSVEVKLAWLQDDLTISERPEQRDECMACILLLTYLTEAEVIWRVLYQG